MWVAIIWSIWNQRNNVVFRKIKVDEEEILCLAQLRIWAWIRSKKKKYHFDILTGIYVMCIM